MNQIRLGSGLSGTPSLQYAITPAGEFRKLLKGQFKVLPQTPFPNLLLYFRQLIFLYGFNGIRFGMIEIRLFLVTGIFLRRACQWIR